MKYIDAEKLIAEIKRLHKAHSGKYGCDEVGINLKYLEDFIDSLQQERPKFPTTDEEVEAALVSIPEVELPDKYKTPDWLFKQQEQTEVGLEKEVKSNINSPSLDEAAEEAMPISYDFLEMDCYGGSEPVYSREQMVEIFKAGAKWMAGQGVTFSHEVFLDDDYELPYIELDTGSVQGTQWLNEHEYKKGDKVVVQIRKAE